jgi:GTP cyclohydrolase I
MSDEGRRHEVGTLHGIGRRESDDWQRSIPRAISPEQWARFEANLREIFEALGMELDTPGTDRTPERFLKAMFEATEGYEGDPKLVTAFPTECRGGPDCQLSQVIEGPIPYYSLCEHHALPFYGSAFVGYIAHENIIGISKLTRLVRLFARRFSVQERMGVQITETLEGILAAHGVALYLDGTHLCTQMRGVRETDSVTRTTFWRGYYAEDPNLRSEFLRMCEMRSSRG